MMGTGSDPAQRRSVGADGFAAGPPQGEPAPSGGSDPAQRRSVGAPLRIGGASGFWGDSSVGAPQLVAAGDLDFLVFDYLAELTMSLLAGARLKNPELGYATDFVSVTMRTVLKDVVAKGIRVISNAGGVNPQACAKALAALAAEQGVAVKIAVVTGDDVRDLVNGRRAEGEPPMLTANAYLGALPIRRALDAGAQIVVTGRCVDSAVTLGALMHHFGWAVNDHDRLAQGSLAGHIIECGCQATGGLFTDWQDVPDWPHMGYPIVECHADGRFTVTKPPGTGGLVTPAVVAEQMLYEIGDPARYLLPDVVCDFTQVRMVQTGVHRVDVFGARGAAPTDGYKVSATVQDGFRCTAQLTLIGVDATAKARRTADAILERTREIFRRLGLADYTETHVEVLGSESAYFGPHAATMGVREVVMHLAVKHAQKAALDLFAREIAPAGTSWAPGTTGAGAGRPSPSPCIRQRALFVAKAEVQPRVWLDGQALPDAEAGGSSTGAVSPGSVANQPSAGVDSNELATLNIASNGPMITVPLIRVTHGRSGDKGDLSNIGIIARQPQWLPWLRQRLTAARVAQWLGHLVRGPVTRFDLPGIHAMNFVCEQALGGGGIASLRNDPLGKGMAQILLSMPIEVPADWGL